MMKRTLSISLMIFSAILIASPLYALELLGAGATFPYPFYAKLSDEYNKKTGVKINYQSIGSGGGIQQLKNQTVDFGASDAFLSDEEAKTMPAAVLHIPTCLGAVALTYNLPGIGSINLTSEVIAHIYLGKIKVWNDPQIAKLNPKIKFPALPISVVHRSDGSGTTSIFTTFLAKRNAEWKQKVGAGKSINWPAGIGGKGNSGVAGLVKQVPGSIGYVEHLYARQNKMETAAVQNDKGVFVEPSLEEVSAAAAGVTVPTDTRVSISDSSVNKGYPISSFTWLLVYEKLDKLSPEKAKELRSFLVWVIHDGQKFTKALDYAPLPMTTVQKAEKIINKLTYNGKKI